MSVRVDSDFDLRSWPFYWITRSNNAYLSTLEGILKRNQLDIPRWRVLMLLSCEQARSVTYLAEEAIIKLSTMTRIIQRMGQEGLVETRPLESDNRVTEVLLTLKGDDARSEAQRAASDVFAKAFEGVSQQEITALNGTLARVLSNLGDKS
jgi:DNA-binding MarR family transcriptional regulator